MIDLDRLTRQTDDTELADELDAILRLSQDTDLPDELIRDVAYLHVNFVGRDPRVRRGVWLLTQRVGPDHRMLALALRTLNRMDDLLGGYAVAYLAKYYPQELAAHCALQRKRWWSPEIGYSSEKTIAGLVVGTATWLLSINRPDEAVELIIALATVPEHSMVGDFESSESAELIVDHEGTDDQKARYCEARRLAASSRAL